MHAFVQGDPGGKQVKTQTGKTLKIIALDAEDLQVISACCQDALLKLSEISYFPADQRFVAAMNRFVWEGGPDEDGQPERRKSVLHFERAQKVSSTGIDRGNKEQILSLLALVFEPDDGAGGTIQLVFSGKAAIRLEVECVEAQLSDMDAAWAAGSIPFHEAQNEMADKAQMKKPAKPRRTKK